MSVPDDSDRTLNQSDFVHLLMKNEPALRAFARSLLPDWNLVDEVIQESSIVLWEKFDQLKGESGFLPWAKVIVRFKCLAAVRDLGRDCHVFSAGVLELLADEAESISEKDQTARMRALRTCLEQFSSPHQELLLAPYAGDGRVKVLAEESGRSANALYKLLGRLREKLSICIRENMRLQQS